MRGSRSFWVWLFGVLGASSLSSSPWEKRRGEFPIEKGLKSRPRLLCFENGGKKYIGLLNASNGNWEISMFFFSKSRVDRFASSRDLVNL